MPSSRVSQYPAITMPVASAPSTTHSHRLRRTTPTVVRKPSTRARTPSEANRFSRMTSALLVPKFDGSSARIANPATAAHRRPVVTRTTSATAAHATRWTSCSPTLRSRPVQWEDGHEERIARPLRQGELGVRAEPVAGQQRLGLPGPTASRRTQRCPASAARHARRARLMAAAAATIISWTAVHRPALRARDAGEMPVAPWACGRAGCSGLRSPRRTRYPAGSERQWCGDGDQPASRDPSRPATICSRLRIRVRSSSTWLMTPSVRTTPTSSST